MNNFVVIEDKNHRIERVCIHPEYTLLYCKKIEREKKDVTQTT